MSCDSDSNEMQKPQNSEGLEIRHDDKFFSMLMSKETSMANSSSRVYYGGASIAVPFMWELHPGTPKHPCCDNTVPPLTPPPSYRSSLSFKSKSNNRKSLSLPTLFSSIFPRFNHASLLHGSGSSMMEGRRGYFSCSRSPPVHNCMDVDDDHHHFGSPTSTACFGVKRRNNGRSWH